MAHIKKRGDSYLIRVGDGYDLEGKQISKHMTWHPPAGMSKAKADREAKRQAALFEEQVKTGMMVDGSIKFADFAQRWFRDYAEEQLRPRTVARYRDLMVRINPAIGHMSMKSIGPVQLMEFYRTLTEVQERKVLLQDRHEEVPQKETYDEREACSEIRGLPGDALQCIQAEEY